MGQKKVGAGTRERSTSRGRSNGLGGGGNGAAAVGRVASGAGRKASRGRRPDFSGFLESIDVGGGGDADGVEDEDEGGVGVLGKVPY